MLNSILMLLMNSLFLMLRVSPMDSFPKPLTKAEEKDCLDRWAAGDVEARNTLVEHNLRLVSHIMKKYYTRCEDMDDLISIGTIGLIKGINTYRADKGVRLATYASRCIENEILMYFRSRRKNAADISLSEALDVDSDGGGLSIMDVLAEDEDLSERIGTEELCRELKKTVYSVLDEREAQVITLRYGLNGAAPMTQKETSEQCGISRSYVSRIEKRALEKLKEVLEDRE